MYCRNAYAPRLCSLHFRQFPVDSVSVLPVSSPDNAISICASGEFTYSRFDQVSYPSAVICMESNARTAAVMAVYNQPDYHQYTSKRLQHQPQRLKYNISESSPFYGIHIHGGLLISCYSYLCGTAVAIAGNG